MTSLAKLEQDGSCGCGSHLLTLAKDFTHYADGYVVEGQWVARGGEREEPTQGEESIRLFCTNCGEYFEVPANV